MNEKMVSSYLPFQASFAAPYGNPWDEGDGIQIGLSMNASIINMDEAFFGVYFYPPESLTNGIFINAHGKRFVNEDSYGARIGYFCSQQEEQKIYMVIQDEDYNPSIYMDKLPEEVQWGQKIQEPDAMNLITTNDVIKKIKQLIDKK